LADRSFAPASREINWIAVRAHLGVPTLDPDLWIVRGDLSPAADNGQRVVLKLLERAGSDSFNFDGHPALYR